MATYLLTIRCEDFREGSLVPGVRLRCFRNDADLKSIAKGRRLQLRRPDGSKMSAMIKDILVDGIHYHGYVEADGGTFYEWPGDPILLFELTPEIKDSAAPPGTELWLID